MGAGQSRIVVQFVTESVLLSLIGAALGLIVASWSLVAIKAGMPAEVEKYILGWKDISLDGRALAFTVLAAVAAGILAGLAPAWQCSRPNLAQALKEGGRGGSAGRERHRLRDVLVAAEIALSVVLLVGASLMVRGVSATSQDDRAFEPKTLLTFQLAITETKYREPYQEAAFYRDLLQKLRAVPGAQAVAAVSSLPHSGHSSWRPIVIEGQVPEPGYAPTAQIQAASASYFRTLHVPLLAGRLLAESDGAETPPVVVISEAMARRWWPGQPFPLGKRIRFGSPDAGARWFTIAGVAGNVLANIFQRGPRPMVFVPYQQLPGRWMDFAIRAAGDPMRLAPAATAAIRSIDPQQPVSGVFTLDVLRRNEATGLLLRSIGDGRLRFAGAGTLGGGSLRRDVLPGGAADSRNRNPHGVGSGQSYRARYRLPAWPGDRRGRPGGGISFGVRAGGQTGVVDLGRSGERPGHVHRHPVAAAECGRPRHLHPGAARHRHRSHCGFTV